VIYDTQVDVLYHAKPKDGILKAAYNLHSFEHSLCPLYGGNFIWGGIHLASSMIISIAVTTDCVIGFGSFGTSSIFSGRESM
jgi:hypothetical protein